MQHTQNDLPGENPNNQSCPTKTLPEIIKDFYLPATSRSYNQELWRMFSSACCSGDPVFYTKAQKSYLFTFNMLTELLAILEDFQSRRVVPVQDNMFSHSYLDEPKNNQELIDHFFETCSATIIDSHIRATYQAALSLEQYFEFSINARSNPALLVKNIGEFLQCLEQHKTKD